MPGTRLLAPIVRMTRDTRGRIVLLLVVLAIVWLGSAQLFSSLRALDGTASWLTVVCSRDVIAGVVSLLVAEPASAVAAEQLLGGEDARLEIKEYRPGDGARRSFGAVYDAALADRAAVLGLASDGQRGALNPGRDALVRPGDVLLIARAPDSDYSAGRTSRS